MQPNRYRNLITVLVVAAALVAVRHHQGASVPWAATHDKLFLLTVDDTLARTPAQAQLLGDVPYWKSLEAKGYRYSHLDAGNTEACKPYADAIAHAGGAPCLLVFTDDNPAAADLIAAEKLPASIAALDARLHTLTGK